MPVIKVFRRSNHIKVDQKMAVLKSPEEKNARGWSAKESLPKIKIEQEGKGSQACGMKKFAEGSEERRK